MTIADHPDSAALIQTTPPEAIVAERNAILGGLRSAIEAHSGARTRFIGSLGGLFLRGPRGNDIDLAETSWAEVVQEVDAHCWQALAVLCRVADFMPPEKRKQLSDALAANCLGRRYQPTVPEFTVEVVQATIAQWLASRRDDGLALVRSLFDRLADRKSNPAHGFARQFIARSTGGGHGPVAFSFYGAAWLEDLYKCSSIAAGHPMPTRERFYLDIPKEFPYRVWTGLLVPGKGDEPPVEAGEASMFRLRPHNNGNIWVRLRPDVLKGLNRMLAGNAPETLGERRKTK